MTNKRNPGDEFGGLPYLGYFPKGWLAHYSSDAYTFPPENYGFTQKHIDLFFEYRELIDNCEQEDKNEKRQKAVDGVKVKMKPK